MALSLAPPRTSDAPELSRVFLVAGAPESLAALRISTALTTILLTLVVGPHRYASLPSELITPPLGFDVPHALVTPTIVGGATIALLGAAAMLLVGWRTRGAAVASAVLATFVLGVPQLYGKVNHYHHVVWLLVVLAACRCADVWSVDARGRARPEPSVAYGFPMRIVWAVIGLLYLLPGLGKLESTGLEWIFSDNLRNLIHDKSWELGGWQPLLPLADHSVLAQAAALGTVLFEVSFIGLVFWRRTRPYAVVAGLAFHLMTFLTMRIFFWVLLLSYVAFIDWGRFARRRSGEPSAVVPLSPVTRRVSIGLLALVALPAIGLLPGVPLRTGGWPVAAYPVFGGVMTERSVGVEVVPVVDGVELAPLRGEDVLGDWIPSERLRGLLRVGVATPARAAALGHEIAERGRLPEGTTELRLYARVAINDPGPRYDETVDRELLATIPV